MKLFSLLLSFIVISHAPACVTYNPGKGTYTVDAQGCVDTKYERKDKESAPSRDRDKSKSEKKHCKDKK